MDEIDVQEQLCFNGVGADAWVGVIERASECRARAGIVDVAQGSRRRRGYARVDPQCRVEQVAQVL